MRSNDYDCLSWGLLINRTRFSYIFKHIFKRSRTMVHRKCNQPRNHVVMNRSTNPRCTLALGNETYGHFIPHILYLQPERASKIITHSIPKSPPICRNLGRKLLCYRPAILHLVAKWMHRCNELARLFECQTNDRRLRRRNKRIIYSRPRK